MEKKVEKLLVANKYEEALKEAKIQEKICHIAWMHTMIWGIYIRYVGSG